MTTVGLALAAGPAAEPALASVRSVRQQIAHCAIVATGATEATLAALRAHLGETRLPGLAITRPADAGAGPREAALRLACERLPTDHVLVLEAGERLAGELRLDALTADGYRLRFGERFEQWELRLLRRATPWRMDGVVDERASCALPGAVVADLEGDYRVCSDRLDGDADQAPRWLAEAARLEQRQREAPDDARGVFLLAQSYFAARSYERAFEHYQRRARLGGSLEELFVARHRLAECMEWLELPWEESRAAYLECFLAHPDRAEPLLRVAVCERQAGNFAAAHICARRAARVPRPGRDALAVQREVYDFRALDEQALSAHAQGDHEDAFFSNAQLLWSTTLPQSERPRIEANRDCSVPHIEQAYTRHDAELVRAIAARPLSAAPQVTLSVIASGGIEALAQTVDSFLCACADHQRIDRWICVDDASSDGERREMQQRFPFFAFVFKDRADRGHAGTMNVLRELIASPFRLDLPAGWRFFERLRYVELALEILAADEGLGQLLFNRHYAAGLAERDVIGGKLRYTPSGVRFLEHLHAPPGSAAEATFWAEHEAGRANLGWPHYALKPSLARAALLRDLGPWDEGVTAAEAEARFAGRFAAAGLRAAFFDTICCTRD